MKTKVTSAACLAALVSVASPIRAGSPSDAPYYMCFAYTQDGMLFAGGDFDFARAQRIMAANCGLPKNVSVVLMKTIMVRKNGNTLNYKP